MPLLKVWVLSYTSGTYVAVLSSKRAAEDQAEINRGKFGGLAVHYPIIREMEMLDEAQP